MLLCCDSNVCLKFLPANTTSYFQPLDQGLILAFKVRYRRHMLRYLVSRTDVAGSATDLCKQLTLLDEIYWISRSWNKTKSSTIIKWFAATEFSETDDSVTDEDNDDIPLARLVHELIFADIDTDRLTSFDNDVPVGDCSEDRERELLSSFHRNETPDETSDNESEADLSPRVNNDMLNKL